MIPLKDTIPSRSFPVVNYALISANLLCFLYEVSLGPYLKTFLFSWGIVPVAFFSPLPLSFAGIIERLFPVVTSMFLHGGWLHIVGNMLYLYIFGDNVEDRLGHLRYLMFYLLCGIAAIITQLITSPYSHVPIIGASGAIAGVMGAYFFLFPHSRIVTLLFLFFFIEVIEIPAFFFLAFWFILQFFSGALSLSSQDTAAGGVAWWAHVGGFLSGVILLFLFKKKGQKRTHRC